ncbi:MAG: hypothetical protein JST82_01105 [Bacteroidetes bacterium]|nr:hypothetical protein [Bacteroidota bacterium]
MGRKDKMLLWWYALAAFLFDITAMIAKTMGHRIPWTGNVFMILELFLISSYYTPLFRNKRNAILLSILLAMFFIAHTLYIRPFNTAIPLERFRLNLTAGALFYLLYIILAMVGFYKLLTGPLLDNILQSRFFWVNVTFLIYASGVFFMFMFAERIRTQDIALGAMLWSTVFCGLNITKNILLAKALSIKDGTVKP